MVGPGDGMGSRGSFLFSFRFPGRNLLGEGGVTTPCALRTLPAVPILAIWRQQAVDLKWSIMSGDYPHLAPGVDIKALLRLMGGPLLSFGYSHTLFVNAPTHLHTHDTHL